MKSRRSAFGFGLCALLAVQAARADDLATTLANATPSTQRLFLAATAGGSAVLVGEGHAPVFADDGERLAYVRQGEVWLWTKASRARRLARVAGAVSRLEWSSDDARLLFVDNRGDHSFVAVLDVDDAHLRYLDPARIGNWGGSWGGYLAALALARNSDVFAAGVDFYDHYDKNGDVAQSLLRARTLLHKPPR